MRLGRDPVRVKQDVRRSATVKDLAARFLTLHVEAKRKPATHRDYRYLREQVVIRAVGELKAEAV